MRGVRRLAHAVDGRYEIEPAAPFNLSAQVDSLRALALTLTSDLRLAENSLLTFLHHQPDNPGPFDKGIWLEVLALAWSSATRATDDLGAQAYALATVMKHALTHNELVAALTQAEADWVALGVSRDTIDLRLTTVEDRRRHAMTDTLGLRFFLEEYHGSSEFEPEGANDP
ncbi:hypothetical protein BH10PSE1_BH10PSE1_23340 [soil metagenome]